MATVEKKTIHALRQNPIDRDEHTVPQIFDWGLHLSFTEFQRLEVPKIVIPDQYKAYLKVTSESYLCKKTTKYSFKEYCPIVFRDLRQRFHVQEAEYLASLKEWNQEGVNEFGVSKSPDQSYFIKMTPKDQAKAFRKIFWPGYRDHMVEFYQESLVSQYTGMYKITQQGKPKTYLLTFLAEEAGRNAKEAFMIKWGSEAGDKSQPDPAPPANRFHLTEDDKAKLLKMLANDGQLMRDSKPIAFGLLVKVYQGCELPRPCSASWFAAANGIDESYFFCLVPIGLQPRKETTNRFRLRRDTHPPGGRQDKTDDEERMKKDAKRKQSSGNASDDDGLLTLVKTALV